MIIALPDSLQEIPLLDRILFSLLHLRRRRGEDEWQRIRRWLEETDLGRRFHGYLSDEAGLLALAAQRLEKTGDEEWQEMGRELQKSAERLWILAGTPPAERG